MRRSLLWAIGAISGAAVALMPVAHARQHGVAVASAGTAVVVPYYTVREGWQTLINVTNTSPNALIVKFRMHEARNARDVMHFSIALAPFDVWTAWIQAGNGDRPFLRTDDSSCTIPQSIRKEGISSSTQSFEPTLVPEQPPGAQVYRDAPDSAYPASRITEGYIELLVMGEADGAGTVGSIPWHSGAADGRPRDCAAVQGGFVAESADWDYVSAIPGDSGSGDPAARSTGHYGPLTTSQPLKVNATLVNQDEGIAVGIESLHLAGWGLGRNLVTATGLPWHLEPTLASHEGLWSTGGLAAIREATGAKAVRNEWASNPRTGAGTDWVLTFPTKRFDTDENARDIRAACSVWRNSRTAGGVPVGEAGAVFVGWPDAPTSPRRVVADAAAERPQHLCPTEFNGCTAFQQSADGESVISATFELYDRQTRSEFSVKRACGPVILPPQSFRAGNPRYATNVLAIGYGLDDASSVLNSAITLPIGRSDGEEWGWKNAGRRHGWLEINDFRDAPVAGFAVKKRDFGAPDRNYAQSIPHAYRFLVD